MSPIENTQQQEIDHAYLRLHTACPRLADKLKHLDVRGASLKELSQRDADDPRSNLVTTERLAIDGDDLVRRIDIKRQKSAAMDITLPASVDAIFARRKGKLLLVEFKDSYVGWP